MFGYGKHIKQCNKYVQYDSAEKCIQAMVAMQNPYSKLVSA